MVSSQQSSEMTENMYDEQSSYWYQHFERLSQSESTIKSYCSTHNLNYNIMYYWRSKFLRQGREALVASPGGAHIVELARIELFEAPPCESEKSEGKSSDFRLWIGEIGIDVSKDFNPESLLKLLRTLRSL